MDATWKENYFSVTCQIEDKTGCKGFTQRYGVNYEETHASVARVASMIALFAICAAKEWKIHQIDVNNAYLNGEIDIERIYIKQPPFFVNSEHLNRV